MIERLRAGWASRAEGVLTSLHDIVGSTGLWERSPWRCPAWCADKTIAMRSTQGGRS